MAECLPNPWFYGLPCLLAFQTIPINVYIPQMVATLLGERFPNIIAETGMMAIKLGPTIEGSCEPSTNCDTTDPTRMDPKIDFALLQDYPKTVVPGQTIPINVSYNLASQATGSLAVSVMYKGPNTLVSGGGVDAMAGRNTVIVLLTIPGACFLIRFSVSLASLLGLLQRSCSFF